MFLQVLLLSEGFNCLGALLWPERPTDRHAAAHLYVISKLQTEAACV